MRCLKSRIVSAFKKKYSDAKYNGRVLHSILDIIIINFQASNGLGSVERVTIVIDAMKQGFGWKLGKGIGAWNIIGGEYAGFLHFGLNSMGSFIYLLGIWGYLIVTIVYTYSLSHMRSCNKSLSLIMTFIVVNLLCFYTMVLTATHVIIWTIFVFLILNIVGTEENG